MEIEIQFHGPFHLRKSESENVLLNSISKEKGLYLWTISFENKYLVYYVGGKQVFRLLFEQWST